MTSINEQMVEKSGIAHSLENVHVLEKKVAQLVELIKAERMANAQLLEEKNILAARLEMLENSLLKEAKSLDELNQEREMTKMIVDELIQSIDMLVQSSTVHTAQLAAREQE